MADDAQAFGLSQEVVQVAKVAAAGAFGAVVYAYLRHPGSMLRATVLISIGVGMALAATSTLTAPNWLHAGL